MTKTNASVTKTAAQLRKDAADNAMKARLDAFMDSKKRAMCFASAAGDIYRKNQSNH